MKKIIEMVAIPDVIMLSDIDRIFEVENVLYMVGDDKDKGYLLVLVTTGTGEKYAWVNLHNLFVHDDRYDTPREALGNLIEEDSYFSAYLYDNWKEFIEEVN